MTLDGLRCQKNSQTLYSQQAYQKNGSFTYTRKSESFADLKYEIKSVQSHWAITDHLGQYTVITIIISAASRKKETEMLQL